MPAPPHEVVQHPLSQRPRSWPWQRFAAPRAIHLGRHRVAGGPRLVRGRCRYSNGARRSERAAATASTELLGFARQLTQPSPKTRCTLVSDPPKRCRWEGETKPHNLILREGWSTRTARPPIADICRQVIPREATLRHQNVCLRNSLTSCHRATACAKSTCMIASDSKSGIPWLLADATPACRGI